MKNQGFLKKLGDFALGKGFYIVLFLCVATIGISGYYLMQTVLNRTGMTEPVGGDASVTLPDQSVTQPLIPTQEPVEQTQTPAVEPAPVEQPDDPEPVKEQTQEPEEEQTEGKTLSSVFTWPVKGEILREYSVDTLSLDPTLDDWRTHGGLDIAAANGVQVLSISAGTVAQVYDDHMMGTTVVVDHGGGLQSWYSNLAQETAVREGDKVDIGSVLGTVGGTAISESSQESHLHLETTLNGKLVDPRDYLK